MLKKVAMNADELFSGSKYIWKVGDVDRIVTVNIFYDGVFSGDDIWWFKDDLEGQLYGPIEFES